MAKKASLYDIHVDRGIKKFGIDAMEMANVGRIQEKNLIVSIVPWKGEVWAFSTARVRGTKGKPRIVHDIRLR